VELSSHFAFLSYSCRAAAARRAAQDLADIRLWSVMAEFDVARAKRHRLFDHRADTDAAGYSAANGFALRRASH
jgi:hypothetical protein